jgi:hypothetical protein
MKNLHMTREQAEAHQRKHGFLKGGAAMMSRTRLTNHPAPTFKPKARGMNKTEQEFSLILESKKRAGKIKRWEFEGIRLKWSGMWYKPDFLVLWEEDIIERDIDVLRIKLIEVKGPWINPRDMVRFKGCRGAWPEFAFEMHQRDKEGRWTRIQ